MIDVAILEKQALSLNFKERGHLATVLLKSLDEDESDDKPSREEDDKPSREEIATLWLEESMRRSKEMDEDPSIGRPGDDVMRDLRSRFG